MAWTNPITYVPGAVLPAWQLNQQLSDNMTFLKAAVDGIQADVQVTDRCIVYGPTQVLPDGFQQPLAFNAETIDVVSGVSSQMHDTVTGNTRIYCRKSGVYYVWGSAEFSTININERQLSIRVNGSVVVAKVHKLWDPSMYDLPWTLNVSCLLKLTNADYVELVAFKNSGPANTVYVNSTSFFSPIFGMIRWPGT